MIDPIALRIGQFQVHWYGIIIASAVLIGMLVVTAETRRRRENVDHAWSMLLFVLIAGIVGARLYHVIHQWGPNPDTGWAGYANNPALIPQVWLGGLGIPGAIIGGALAIIVYTRLNKLNTPRWLDIAAPGMLLAQAIGRLGNFVNQELYGPPTTLPWGIPISAAGCPDDCRYRIEPYQNLPADTLFHPLFAYEALLNLLGMFVLLFIARRFARRLYDGDIALLYFVWYGSVRTALEPLRADNWYIGPLPAAIWFGSAAVLLALAFLVLRHLRGWGTPGAWMDRETSGEEAAAVESGGRFIWAKRSARTGNPAEHG